MVELLEEALRSYFGWNRMTETETRELKTYEMVEFRGKGQLASLDFLAYSNMLGCLGSEQSIAADMLRYLEGQGRMTINVFDGGQYKALESFQNSDCLYVNGGNLQMKLTIPGRIRYEQLGQRHLAETAQATQNLMPESGVGIEPLVAHLKKLIAEPTHPLKLHDFLMPLADEARVKVEASEIVNYGTRPSQQAFTERVVSADEATSKLAKLLIVGCHWADAQQAKIFGKALAGLIVNAVPQGAYYTLWEGVAKYPALRAMYAAGVAACANDSFEVLRVLLVETKSRLRPHEPELPIVRLLHQRADFFQDHWRWLDGMERRYCPVSDYILNSLRVPLREIVTGDEDLLEKFARFEIFQSLIYGDLDHAAEGERFWAPSGTFTYRSQDSFDELRSDPAERQRLEATASRLILRIAGASDTAH